MLVIGKDDNRTYEVYDVSYDHNGFPKFLIFKGKQWVRLSAKHFIPFYFRNDGEDGQNVRS